MVKREREMMSRRIDGDLNENGDLEGGSLQAVHDQCSRVPDMTLEKLIHLLQGYAAIQDERVYTTSRCSLGEHVTKISGVWRDSHGNVVIGYKDAEPEQMVEEIDLCEICCITYGSECYDLEKTFGDVDRNIVKCDGYEEY